MTDIKAAVLRVPLDEPYRFGEYVIDHRDYAIVRARDDDGRTGTAFGLTRGAPVCEFVHEVIAPHYAIGDLEPGELFARALTKAPAALLAGSGHRALSIVDLAVWDLLARSRQLPMIDCLAPSRAGERLEVVALVGYPPSLSADDVLREATTWYAQGCRSFKAPIAASAAETRARLEALATLPDARLMLDAVWSMGDARSAADYLKSIGGEGSRLSWFEDPFPPGALHEYRELAGLTSVPLCGADDAGGSYYPDALIATGALSFLRVDATCMGGATRFADLCAAAARTALRPTAHIFPVFHIPLLAAAGGGLVEWGRPGAGLDPLSDRLPAPSIEDGYVIAPTDGIGFGATIDPDWAADHVQSDPYEIIRADDG